ncbi:hypothetical protein [Rhizobium sp. RM]|uniref:hypothetical protein n=1 Tax=Rhizobium sp. RM TaxID=2748079 RepID=UPI00110D63DE|nr:hypothetical protein [Rhizobium sp. RM]NWJ22832.1 hypothetical protein [Rhizobium sp. RM]TMV12267.1 hypothetical protein BJG94_25150 [Rhizobium sp. Td3]
MRAYVLGSFLFWAAVFLVWHLYALYKAENGFSHGRSSVAKAEVISASQCSGEVAALLAMSDKLLKAGGPEVPVSLRRNIEHCISFDDASREKIIGTQLIRFFPGEK